ncbi:MULTISPECIES: peptidoglycan-binding protein [unclassified Aureimonas]|uniref:peptidoglycan-binding protein n=1 Tax=unclassified Aureimonas TaxID=2615206 RepID=UPI0006FC6F9D|nr:MULTISPECIES: peptidoglycan-binding protein [unclassified Aureimonas]KQT55128.1 hypothetical protein ASG62_09735 [Aureimonas sp. Leaf427]KQT70917.1 hypothetical protein ASG54_20120 [Aureimonas sp. Leaf460]
MLKSRAPSQDTSVPAPDASPLASLSRTLLALEERLSRLPSRAEPRASVPMVDPEPAPAPAPAEAAGLLRRMALTDAASEIVMRRQMLDRDVAADRAPSAAGRSAEPVRLHPRVVASGGAAGLREEQLKTLAVDAETLKAEGSGYSAISEVAAELQRLREEIRRDSQPKADPRFDEMRAAFEELRGMILSRESQERVGSELTRIADGLAQLTEDGADRSTLNTLRAELEAMRGLFAEVARETSLKAETEIEVKRDIKDELKRLRESLRSLASEDQIKAVEKRWNEFEERYEASPVAPDETAISRLLQTELESVRDQIEALSDKAPMDAVEKRWDALEERLDTRQMELTIQKLAERMGDLETQLAQLPNNQAISALDARMRTIAEGVETLALQSVGPDLEQFVIIEDRLDEISRAIVATSLQQPAIDMAPIERIEARIATLTARIDVTPSNGETEMLAERVAELTAKLDVMSSDTFPVQIAERMAVLAERFEAAFAELEAPRLDTSAIEARLSALTSRLEDKAVPQFDRGIVQALEVQIARLAASLDRPDRLQSTEADPEIERRLAAIEQRLDDQRDALIAAAREIADDTAKRMQDVGDRRQGEHIAQLSENLKALEGLSRANDERAGQVFESLHGTLMKIVDRLEQIEIDVGGRRAEAPTAETKVAVKALTPAAGPKPVEADRSAPAFLRAGDVAVAEKPVAREAVSAPSLDASEMLDRREANRPLEPGSGAPDIGALLERLQLQRGGKGGSNREPLGDAELVAAARRASRAAAAAVETEAKAAQASAGPSGAGRLSSFMQRRRKPILVAVLAVIAALAALTHRDELGSLVSAQFDGGTVIDGTVNPVAAIPSASATSATEGPAAASAVTAEDAEPATSTAPAAPVASAAIEPKAAEPAVVAPEQAPAPAAVAAAPAPAATAASTIDAAAILARAEAKLPAQSLGAIPALPENIGSAALATAAKGGDAMALFEVGLRLMEGRNGEPKPADALVWFAQSAKRGFAPAQYSLGTLFEKGNGVARDTGAARDWYLLAAEQGNVRAMHNLAVLYATGIEGVSDPDTALGWFEKAAGYGMRDSQYNLGILYARGSGTEQDLVSSYKWFSIVSKTGDKDAEAKMQEIAKSLAPEQLKRAEGLVSGWAPMVRPEAANTVELPPAWADKSDTTASVDMKRAVRNIQAILGKLGYDAGRPDGVIGEKTKMAILAFQKKSGLQATGSVDEPLIRALLERKDG